MSRIQPLVKAAVSTAAEVRQPRQVIYRRGSDTYRCLPDLYRSMDEVDGELRAVFRKLATGEAPWPLYLHGDVGVGKTRAVLALCDVVDMARYWTLDQIVRSILARQAPWQGVWRDPSGPQLAVLDEIGTHQRTTDLEYDALKLFSDWREDLPTVYVSNHPLKKIERLYDERIESRLGCGTTHPLEGVDRRRLRS